MFRIGSIGLEILTQHYTCSRRWSKGLKMELARITILENNVTGTTKYRIVLQSERMVFYNTHPKHKYSTRYYLAVYVSLIDLYCEDTWQNIPGKKLKKCTYSFSYSVGVVLLHEFTRTQIIHVVD